MSASAGRSCVGQRLRAGRARARPACRALARPAASASSSLRSKVRATSRFSGSHASNCRSRALGLILGSLQREALTGEQLLVLVLELADRAGGRGHPGRRDRFQERVDDRLLQSATAE